MRATRFSWAAVMGVLTAVAIAPQARAEQLAPAGPPAQIQQTVPARPEPVTPSDQGGASTTPRDQVKAPVAPGPAPQQFTPGMSLAPARP
jgi:hypothetical protein